ncbi:hypothetical protein EVAR_66479_1 [Eumeta japonica]|uniref:Uncharacterized protein n=1 Tax=Eumeta variegata TaxID=151549 RepID=A0A4C2A0Y1_EUMVA|nr:hypothetical protein EVAR_66479_1 [Eumeta japonica]
MLSLFDEEVDLKTKTKMINNLNRDESSDSAKRYIPSKGEIAQNFFNMTLDDFVTQRSKQFLSRLQIDDSFLREDVSSWRFTQAQTRGAVARLQSSTYALRCLKHERAPNSPSGHPQRRGRCRRRARRSLSATASP